MAKGGGGAGEASRSDERAPLCKGARIGGFVILGRLGKGGMGAVFKARQLSMDRPVALKILPPELAENQTYVQRFIREARSAARFSHPNIVQGIDVGFADGYYYFAMELVDGITVRQLMKKEGVLDERRALAVVADVARGLENAREEGIVHRDIKPANIMITHKGVVKLADLGLARSTEKPDTVTTDHKAIGTPHYMSPEQVQAEADIDTRSDIYSLGATLFHMVVGEFPFHGPTSAVIMARRLAQGPPSARERNGRVSRATSELIEHMMAVEREDRPQTPAELLAGIEDALAGKVRLHTRSAAARREARPQATPRPRPHARRRSAGLWIALGGAGALGLAALVVLMAGRGRAPEPAKKAAAPSTKAAAAVKREPTEQELARRRAEQELVELRSQVAGLLSRGRFGDAEKRIDAFIVQHAGGAEADAAAALRRHVREKGDERYAQWASAADAAAGKGEFAAARRAMAPAASAGTVAMVARARGKLDEIAALERRAEAGSKWEAIQARARQLAEDGKYEEALAALEPARSLGLADIGERVAREAAAVRKAQEAKASAALAAYREQSDRVWALLRGRKYGDADKLIAELAANPAYEAAGKHLSADREAARQVGGFWSAVEKALAARKGKFLAVGRTGGKVTAVADGRVTLEQQGAAFSHEIRSLDARQAAALSGLKNSDLRLGLFLLAEGIEPGRVAEALAAAPESPHLAFYGERLEPLAEAATQEAATKGATELKAELAKALARIRSASSERLDRASGKRLLELVDAFGKKYAGVDLPDDVRQELIRIRNQAETLAQGFKDLFDGTSLDGWEVVKRFWVVIKGQPNSGQGGKVSVGDKQLVFEKGRPETGIKWKGAALPKASYELLVEYNGLDGVDCHIVFPVGEAHSVLDIGDKGVRLDIADGHGNPTERARRSEGGRWYQARIRVSRTTVDVWIDDEKVSTFRWPGEKIRIHPTWQPCKPLGVGTWGHRLAVRRIAIRELPRSQ